MLFLAEVSEHFELLQKFSMYCSVHCSRTTRLRWFLLAFSMPTITSSTIRSDPIRPITTFHHHHARLHHHRRSSRVGRLRRSRVKTFVEPAALQRAGPRPAICVSRPTAAPRRDEPRERTAPSSGSRALAGCGESIRSFIHPGIHPSAARLDFRPEAASKRRPRARERRRGRAMEYFTVSYPAGARLSMSVVGREDAALPRLGNTVVDGVDAPGYSHDGGVQRGDFIISVNDQYVAFTGNAEVVRLLQSIMKDQKELSIRFARPKESEWKRINGSSEHPIREGSMNKLHQGLFKKWNSRHFKVTRETFSSSVDSVLKNKFDVDGDIGRPRLATGYPLHQGVFELRCGEKDVILQTNSTEHRDLWMHAIECAIEKTFFQPLPSQHTSRNGQAYVPNSRPPLPPPTEQSTDGMEAYLRMGREAILSNQNASNGGGPRQVRASSHGDGSSAAETGVYKILSLSSVQAIGGPDTIISLAPNFTNPADLAPALVDYDFSLEMKALEKRDMYEDAH